MKAALLVVLLLGEAMASDPMTPQLVDGRYQNPWGINNSKSLWTVLKWKLSGSPERWPDKVSVTPKELPLKPASGAIATWVNHSTFLVQLPHLNILFDPVYSERVSPVSWAGPRRVHDPGIPWEKLPKIDVVMVSHNHYDHCDIETLVKLYRRDAPLFLVPKGDGELLAQYGISRVEELTWWQESMVGDTRFVFTPAQHWSARGTLDRNKSLWGGFWVQHGELKLFHAGDTGLGPHFKEIRARLGTPSFAMLPIGAYEPRWFMKDMHMNPSDAVQAWEQLGRPRAVGMHFGSFQLTDEGIERPAQELSAALGDRKERIVVPIVGESFFISTHGPEIRQSK